MFKVISQWFTGLARVWRREFYLVFSDAGVIIFFFALPLLYPIVYTLIYNPEIVENLPVVVVDDSRSPESRELARMLDATQAIEVYDYAANLSEARRMMNEHRCYGIMEIPSDYGRKLGRGEQAVVTFYSDMSLLLRYRAFLSALTDVQLAVGAQIRSQLIDDAGLVAQGIGSQPVNSEAVMLGDPTQGFASFVIPGIVVLILQQSMILGVTMLAAGSSERRRRNRGYDPLAVNASPTATVIGKMLCYVVIYLPLAMYILHIVPWMFSLPHVGDPWQYMLFILPMLVASAFLGLCISPFVSERESSMLVVVFTSVVFLFLSGLTWPRYAMNGFWTLVGDCIPATWGVEGFIRMNSNGSPLWEQSRPFTMMWILSGIYFIIAWLLARVGRGSVKK